MIRIVIMSWNEDLVDVDHRTHDNWVVYFKTWSRRSLFYGRAQTCRNQSNVWNSRRLLHVTLKFETKILRSDIFCPGEPHQRSPNASKFEDRSQEETEWQEQGAREAAWKLAKSVLEIEEQERATFFSPSENWCLPASNFEPGEREFVVDSGASMHLISKKDLSDAEMDTLTKSCSPTIVITANGEVQTHEEATVYVKELENSGLWKSSKTRQQYCRSESFAMKTDILMNGSMVKNHISLKTGLGFYATRRTSFLLWFPACQVCLMDLSSTSRTPLRQESHCSSSSSSSSSSPTVSGIQTRERGDQTESDISSVHVSTTVDDRSGRPDNDQANKNPKPNKKETTIERGRLVKFWNPGVAASIQGKFGGWWIPAHGDSHTSSSHEASLEPIFKTRDNLGKHSVYTHPLKTEIARSGKGPKFTRAPCRRRNSGAVPRAEIFGDLITAYHKVLSDNCESRNNHRYAVVVQDLATQWIQAYPCKTKTSQQNLEKLAKVPIAE